MRENIYGVDLSYVYGPAVISFLCFVSYTAEQRGSVSIMVF